MNRDEIMRKATFRAGNYYVRPIGRKGRASLDYSHPLGDDSHVAVFNSEGVAKHHARVMHALQDASPEKEAWLLHLIHDRRADCNDEDARRMSEDDAMRARYEHDEGERDCPECGAKNPYAGTSLAH